MRKYILMLAAASLSTLLFAQSDSAIFYLQKGQEEKAKGLTMVSFQALNKAYNFDKNNKQIVSELAQSLLDLRRYSQAREKYLELEKLGDQSANTYNQLMNLSFNMRQFPDAIKYAQLLKKVDPAAKISYFVGKAHYDQENYGEAVKHLAIAGQEDPQNAEIPYTTARSYADMNNYKAAIPFFEKALTLQPENNRWMYEMGLIYYAMNDDKNSLKYLMMAAEKGYKKDNEYLENLAVAYLNNKQTDNALGILKEALNRRPSDAGLMHMIAEANYDAKRYDEAINYWDQALTLNKQDASALYMIGMSYQQKGEKAKGQALSDKAIQMDPNLSKNRQKREMPGL